MSQSQKWWSMGLLPLREELKSKGLETHGSKPVLVRRLEVYEERINALKAKSTPVQMRKSPAKSEVSSGEPAPVKESPPVPDTAKPDQQKSAVTDTESNQQQEEEKPKDWWTLSMQDLKNECSKRNLSFMGNKYTLVNRLKGYDSLNKKLLVSTIVKTNTPTPVASSPDAKVMPPTKQVTPPTQKPPDTTAPPAIKPTTPSPAKASPPVEQPQQDIVKVEIERINKLTLAQLKIECVNKKLNISGSRTELLERLKQHVQKAQNTTGSKLLSTPSVTSKPQTPAPSPVVTSIKVSESNWSPVAQKTPVTPSPTVKPPAAQAPVQVAPVKRIVTSSVGVQTDKTEEIDRPQPVKHFYSDEQVETAKKFSSKLPYWEDKNGKCPDVFLEYLPVKECERRARSLLLYPITYKDTQDPDFNKLRQTARSCILKFTDHRSINRALRGSVELEFFTRKACQTAQEQLKTWRKDLKVEMLSDHDTLDAALVKVGERPAKSEPTVNRLIFLNKLPMKLKEGSLAEKFSDAASICIAKDSFNVSKGYGFVESATTADAQAAFNKNRNLYLEGARIEVSMYPKVPANLEEDKHRLVLPDSERLKLSEKHHQATLDFNRAKSGPYNRDRSTDQSLLKEMSVLEEKLAVDAAIRKKLGYASLPEPASFMSTEMRKAWQTGDFSSFKVDLGGIHKDWGEPKVKAGAVTTKVEGKKDISGPTPAKVSKMDDSAKTDQVGRDEKMASRHMTAMQMENPVVDLAIVTLSLKIWSGPYLRNPSTTHYNGQEDGDYELTENETEVNPDLLEECQRSAQADEDGDLPIHIAVVHANLLVMERLLYMMSVAKIPIDYYNNLRQTPLHLAIITQNEIAVTRLLEHNANPNLPDRKGLTGLHLAVKYRTKSSMKAIMENASCELQLDAKNYEGFTALHLAVIDNQLELVQLLVDAGAALDVMDGKSGRTALFHAAEAKLFTIASLLLQKGASVNTTNYSGNTAVQAANGRGHTEMVALFIKYGADVTNSMRDSEIKADQKSFVVSQNMSQVKETVRDNMLKRQQRKRQIGDPRGRTVGDLLHIQQGSTADSYSEDKTIIAISPDTPSERRSFSPISIKSSDSVPQSPGLDIPRINLPTIRPGTLSKDQDLKDIQRALLEQIAPTPEVSPKRKSHSSSTSSLQGHSSSTTEVVIVDGSPPEGNDTDREDVGKRPPLTIDPRMVNIPTKKPRFEERGGDSDNNRESIRQGNNMVSIPSPKQQVQISRSEHNVINSTGISHYVPSQTVTNENVFLPEGTVTVEPVHLNSSMIQNAKVTHEGHGNFKVNTRELPESSVLEVETGASQSRSNSNPRRQFESIIAMKKQAVSDTSSLHNVSEALLKQNTTQQLNFSAGRFTQAITSVSQIYTVASDSTTRSSKSDPSTGAALKSPHSQQHQYLTDVVVMSSAPDRDTGHEPQERKLDSEARVSTPQIVSDDMSQSKVQTSRSVMSENKDTAMETDDGDIVQDIATEVGQTVDVEQRNIMDVTEETAGNQIAMTSEKEVSTTRLNTEPTVVQVTEGVYHCQENEVVMDASESSHDTRRTDSLHLKVQHGPTEGSDTAEIDTAEVSATSMECDSSCNEEKLESTSSSNDSLQEPPCTIISGITYSGKGVKAMPEQHQVSSSVDEVSSTTEHVFLDATAGKEECSPGEVRSERKNIFETLSETKLLSVAEESEEVSEGMKVYALPGKRPDDMGDQPLVESEGENVKENVSKVLDEKS